MVDYRRKRKRAGKSHSRKRPYTPNLGGGGYSGPRNYLRTHDFKYEREPSSRPPKTETHYEVIERPSTDIYRPPTFYRPEPDQALMEKAVGRVMEKYLRDDSEQNQGRVSQAERRPVSETPPSLQEVGLEANRLETGTAINEKALEIDSTEAPALAEPLVGISQEVNPVIDKAAELYESYELPVKDLELLLVELDANPLEVRPERNIEAESVREQ